MVQKRSAPVSTNEPKQKKGKSAGTGPAVENLVLAELLDKPDKPENGAQKGVAKAARKRSGPAQGPTPSLQRELDGDDGARPRKAEALRLAEVVVGYDGAEEPTPIRLVARGKDLAEGEVFETQSDEIRKEYPQSPIAKACRAKYNWVAETDGGRFTRDPNKMLPIAGTFGSRRKWTCDVCGKCCSEQLFVFRAFLRKEYLHSLERRCLDPFVAYISSKCGRGLLGQLSEYTRFKEEVFSLTTRHSNLDEARVQLEESLKRCNREDQQFLMDELERLAGVGPGCAPKTVEMDSVERLVPGSHPAVLLRTAEDVFRAMARTLAPRVGARIIAAATLAQLQQEGRKVSGYLHSVSSSLEAGGPLPQVPLRWPLAEVEICLQAALRAINGEGDPPQLRVELACSWDAKLKAFGPKKAQLTIRLGYLQARQALHAFVPSARLSREDAALLHQRFEAMIGELQPVQGGLASSLPGMNLRPALRFMGRAESLGYGWHSADWAQRLKDLLGVRMDFTGRPLRLATGCSGAEAPHFALQQLVGHEGFEQLWGSEINENPRRFILKNCPCQHLFEDVCYIMEGGGRCARHGGHCSVPAGEVDIFVGGFPCTPYSFCNPKRFKRNCFTEPAAVPFFEMRKFIAERRPRLVILENVRGLLAPNPETDHPPIDFILRGKNPENAEDCYQGTAPNADWGLSLIEGYGLRWDVLYSCDWGLPQSRPRVYIVMVRDDAGGQAAAERIFEVLSACAGRMPRGSCNDFLFADDHPQLQAVMRQWAIKPEQKTSGGRRACTKFTEALFRTKRQELGLDSRDRPHSGKRPSGWYPHATEKMVQQLDIIHAVAEKQGLDFDFLLADLSQQVSRGAWRDDGNIPTLTTGSVLYSFNRHRPFLGEECLRLNGFPIEQLNLDAHSEAERVFLAGNAMSVPVVGAVLFAALVSLSWGDQRVVCHNDSLPEPLQMRPDIRKLTQPAPGSVVLAQLAPSLLDDECEVIPDLEETQKPAEDTELARRAAVLLALTRELTSGIQKRKADKDFKDTKEVEKSSGLMATMQAAASPADTNQPAAGDGTGWEMRYRKVMDRLKAPKDESTLPNSSLKKWLQEASDLLLGMGREERNTSANELQQFVVKTLQVFRDAPDDAGQIHELGLENILTQLCNLRFPEAKELYGRLAAQKLQADLFKPKADKEMNWKEKALQLTGAKMSGARAQLLNQLIRQGRHKLARFFVPLLQLWHKEDAEDQELLLMQKGVEILRKAWATADPEDIWNGFKPVCWIRQCCLEIAKNCENRRRPKSSQSFHELAQKLQYDIFISRATLILKNQMGIQALKNFQDFMEDAANLEEQMGWSAAPSTQSIWNLLCFLFDTLKDVDWSNLDFSPPPSKELCAMMGFHLMVSRQTGSELAMAVDALLLRMIPNLAMRLHLNEFKNCQEKNASKAVEDAKQRCLASLRHFLTWSNGKLGKLTFDFAGWSSIKLLEEGLTNLSLQMDVFQKSLMFALMEMKQVTGESDDLFRMCFRLCEYSRQRIEVQGKCQEFLAKLTIMEHLLQRNMMGGLLEFPEIRRGLADALELGPGATLEHVKNCLEKHSAKAPDEVIEDIIKALKVELMVPAPWTRNQSSNGLYFFRIENRDVTSWIWPVQDMLDVIMQNQDVVPDMEDLHYGGMTPPMDIAEDEDHASIATVPTTPAIGLSESPTSVPGTTSAVAPSCVVHPSAAAQRLNPPAFVPSSPSEGEDIEIMGATTPPAPRFQAPRVQKPPEPLEPPSSEGFLSRKPPEPQMPPRYVKEHAAPPAQPSTPPKSGRPKSPARKLPRVLQPQLIPLPPLLPSPLPPPPPPPPPPPQEAQHGQINAKVPHLPKPPEVPPPPHLYDRNQSYHDWSNDKRESW